MKPKHDHCITKIILTMKCVDCLHFTTLCGKYRQPDEKINVCDSLQSVSLSMK